MDWNDIKYVLAIAETGNLHAAAKSLKVNHTTVWRRVQLLEKTFESQIFITGRKGYHLTDAGKKIIKMAKTMETNLDSIERVLKGQSQDLKGVIRVTAPPTLGALNFPANLIREFRELYPDIHFELNLSNQVLDIERREADIAFRAGLNNSDNLIGHQLGSESWYLMVSNASYKGDFLPLKEICNWPLIGYHNFKPQAVTWFNNTFKDNEIVLKCNDVASATSCVRAGIGIGLLPFSEFPGLTAIYKLPKEYDSTFWLLTHKELRQSAKIKAFWDFVVKRSATKPLVDWQTA